MQKPPDKSSPEACIPTFYDVLTRHATRIEALGEGQCVPSRGTRPRPAHLDRLSSSSSRLRIDDTLRNCPSWGLCCSLTSSSMLCLPAGYSSDRPTQGPFFVCGQHPDLHGATKRTLAKHHHRVAGVYQHSEHGGFSTCSLWSTRLAVLTSGRGLRQS